MLDRRATGEGSTEGDRQNSAGESGGWLAVRSEGLRAYVQVLNLLSRGQRIDAHEIVLEDDKHYYRCENDDSLERLISARLLAAMRRQRLVHDGQYWEITDRGRVFLTERFRQIEMVD